MLKIDEPFWDLYKFSFFQQFRFGFWEENIFFLQFLVYNFPLAWIQIRIQEVKIWRIQRIRILSTGTD